MSGLAALLTAKEQNGYQRLTHLTFDAETQKNLATYEDEQARLGVLTICAAEGYGTGKRILTTTALIRGVPTEIGIYRLPV